MRHWLEGLVLGVLLLVHSVAWGAHPLVTDDAGTQGTGKFQVEVNVQADSDKESVNGVSVESKRRQIATTLSYGFVETADLALSFPYERGKVKEDGVTVFDEHGMGDATLEVKWRFFARDGLSLALKPGLRVPTGNDEKGLGAGRMGYQAFLIGSLESAPLAFHANVGYIRNENKADEERNIWHASLAATCEVAKNLKAVGNIGIERNPDRAADQHPAFLLGGLIYSLFENVDIDVGVKYGLTAAETDWSLLAGAAFRF